MALFNLARIAPVLLLPANEQVVGPPILARGREHLCSEFTAPGWGNTLVLVENTKPIPVLEPMLPVPSPSYSSPTPRSTPTSPPYVPGDMPKNPDATYMEWLQRIMPSDREEVAIVEYVCRLETGEEVQQQLVIQEE